MLERIDDEKWDEACNDPEHLPPKHMYLLPGTWRHTCPSCGKITEFTVPRITC